MENDFLITHVGEGSFTATLESGEVKQVGPGLGGIIRFTYFEDYTIPPDGWTVQHSQLLADYQPKVFKVMQEGRFYRDPKDGMYKVIDKQSFN